MKKSKTHRIFPHQLCDDCPVIIQEVDVDQNQKGNTYSLKLELSNIGAQTILSVYLKLILLDDAGDIIQSGGPIEINYVGINCPSGGKFGERQLIPIQWPVRQIKLHELKVVLADNTVLRFSEEQFVEIEPPHFVQSELKQKYRKQIKKEKPIICYSTKLTENFYRCACGGIVQHNHPCTKCGRHFQELPDFEDASRLSKRLEKTVKSKEKVIRLLAVLSLSWLGVYGLLFGMHHDILTAIGGGLLLAVAVLTAVHCPQKIYAFTMLLLPVSFYLLCSTNGFGLRERLIVCIPCIPIIILAIANAGKNKDFRRFANFLWWFPIILEFILFFNAIRIDSGGDLGTILLFTTPIHLFIPMWISYTQRKIKY